MTATVLNDERRDYSRCLLDARAELRLGTHLLACEVKNVSLQGALVRTHASIPRAADGQACTVTIHLDRGAAAVIVMRGRVAHVHQDHIGVACREIDLDSFIHLRRIVDLGLGEDKLALAEIARLPHSTRRDPAEHPQRDDGRGSTLATT